MHYGITVPFIACSIFSLLASFFVMVFWKESPKQAFQNHEKYFGSRKPKRTKE